MSTLLAETQEALGGDAIPHCDSRALRLARYARPDLKGAAAERYLRQAKPGDPRLREIDGARSEKRSSTLEKLDARRDYLEAVVAAGPQRRDDALASWHSWLDLVANTSGKLIHARLEARLLINMGGSVLENAGLQLDRFGTAFVPGSAVKACARRTALAALRQWCETGEKPIGDDVLATASMAFGTQEKLLLAVLRVFGCTDLEWDDFDEAKQEGNDLAWACADQWLALRDAARATLNAETRTPDEPAPTRQGRVAFLPSFPRSRPEADLELDVLTSHHQAYYSSDEPSAIATDDENPIPVFFPAVAKGATYTFALLPVGGADATILTHARAWLATGLSVFGLGAKTAAGYGFFGSVDYDTLSANSLAEAATAAKAREADRIAQTPSDDALLHALRGMKEDSLRGKIKVYSYDSKLWPSTDTEQTWITCLRYLTQENPVLWNKEKGNEKSAVTKAMRSLAQKVKFPLSL